jgi:hypothetical protein
MNQENENTSGDEPNSILSGEVVLSGWMVLSAISKISFA